MKIFLVILILIGVFVLKPSNVLACSCAPPRTPTESLQIHTNVFSGNVTNISKSNEPGKSGNVLVTFKVMKVWKGDIVEKLTLSTHDDSVACGYPFEKGIEYLVYANKSEDDMLGTSICSSTKKLSSAQMDIKALGSGVSIQEGALGPLTLYREHYVTIGIIIIVVIVFLILFIGLRNRKK